MRAELFYEKLYKKAIKFYNQHAEKYIKNNTVVLKDRIILFICEGNSGRSQMAEAFFNFFSKNGRAISAGTNPDKKIHPWTTQIMKEVGINIEQKKPKLLSNKLMKSADKIIIMDFELLDTVLSKYLLKTEEWKIGKLLGKSIKQVRKIRNQIEKKVKQLIKKNNLFGE